VIRAAQEPAAVIELFGRSNGQTLLPILDLIENARRLM
jgi:hypothetical protein